MLGWLSHELPKFERKHKVCQFSAWSCMPCCQLLSKKPLHLIVIIYLLAFRPARYLRSNWLWHWRFFFSDTEFEANGRMKFEFWKRKWLASAFFSLLNVLISMDKIIDLTVPETVGKTTNTWKWSQNTQESEIVKNSYHASVLTFTNIWNP